MRDSNYYTPSLSPSVMRASGSYRVLFNTHLWAEMKCERANQKSIRITAQDNRESIAVFLITVSAPSLSLSLSLSLSFPLSLSFLGVIVSCVCL